MRRATARRDVLHMTTTLPYFRLRRCGASRRTREASSRISSCCSGETRWRGLLFVGVGFGDKEIGEAAIGIKSDDALGIGDEIGEGVHVVIEKTAGRVVDNVFDAADFDSREMHEALDGGDDFAGR